MDAYFGEYGGRVTRKFIGAGEVKVPGDILYPEDVETWPLSNRKALQTMGKVKWFGPPVDMPVKKAEPQPPGMSKKKSATKRGKRGKRTTEPKTTRKRNLGGNE